MKRTVAFYWVSQRSRDGYTHRPVGDVNWREALSLLQKTSWEDKAIGDIRYDVVLDREYPILSVYEKFDSAFMGRIDDKNKRVTDYMDEYIKDNGNKLAKSSAYAFFPNDGIVGRISGSSVTKNINPLKKALDKYWPLEKNFEWYITPVVTIDSLEKFEKELKGLSSVQAKFTTQQTLTSSPDEGGDMGRYYQKIAKEIAADVDVEVKISISDDTISSSPMKKLKRVMGKFVYFAAKQGKTIRVSGVDIADKLVELNLVEHQITEQRDVFISDKTQQFTSLIDCLVSVCKEQEKYLYQATEGDYSGGEIK